MSKIPMYEVNCRLISEADGNLTLDLASHKAPVVLRASHCTLRPRRPNPNNPMSVQAAKKYPRRLTMPLALAQAAGIARKGSPGE